MILSQIQSIAEPDIYSSHTFIPGVFARSASREIGVACKAL